MASQKVEGGRNKALGRKVGRRVAEISAFLLAVLAGLAAILYWRALDGGLSLNILTPQVEKALEERLADGSNVTVGALSVTRKKSGGPVRLIADDLVLESAGGDQLVKLPRLAIRINAGDLIKGKIQPQFIEVLDATVSINRFEDGHYDLALRQSGATGSSVDVDFLQTILDGKQSPSNAPNPMGLFEGAILQNMTLIFEDAITDTLWQIEGVEAEVLRSEQVLIATVDAPLRLGDETSSIRVEASFNQKTETASAFMIMNNTPVSDILKLVLGDGIAQKFDATVSGTVEIATNLKGNVKAARFDVATEAGSLTLGETNVPLNRIALTTDYAPEARAFIVENFFYDIAGNTSSGGGKVSLLPITTNATEQPDQIIFDLNLKNTVLQLPGILQDTLPVPTATLSGGYDFKENILDLKSIDADVFKARVIGGLKLSLPTKSGEKSGFVSKAHIEGSIVTEELMRVWPYVLAPGARRWIADNIAAGDITKINFDMNVARGFFGHGNPMAKEDMTLAFAFENTEATYVPGLTPIKGAKGEGVVYGNSVDVNVSQGRIGNIILKSGRVDMPSFFPFGQDAYYSAAVEGDVEEMLSLIDQAPLNLMQKADFEPERFSGDGSFNIKLTRPLKGKVKPEEMSYDGSGQFSNLNLEEFIPKTDIDNGEGIITLNNSSVRIEGSAVVRGAAIDLEWERELRGTKKTKIAAQGVITPQTSDAFGLPLRQFLRGSVPYTLTVSEQGGLFGAVDIKADLAKTELRIDDFNWKKPAGTAGALEISVVPPSRKIPDSKWNFERVHLDTEGFKIDGKLVFSAGRDLLSAQFGKVFIENRADLKGTAQSNDDGLSISLSGNYLEGTFLLDSFLQSQEVTPQTDTQPIEPKDSELPGGVSLDIDLKKLDLKNDISLQDFTLDMQHNGAQLISVNTQGRFANGGGVLRAISVENPDAIGRDITVYTDQLGYFLEGVFDLNSVQGGVATLRATIIDNGPLAGHIEAEDFRIINAPLIARLFSAGSFNGLADLLNNDGIEIAQMTSDIRSEDGVLSLIDTQATGPSVGLSANGDVNYKLRALRLNGAVAPAYGVNGFFGNIPGLGELLVSRKGEGVLAVSYRIVGEMSEPIVTVNALSALTPGIFRRIFEPVRGNRPSTQELLDAAIIAAREEENIQYAPSAEQIMELDRSLDDTVPDDVLPIIEVDDASENQPSE